MIFWAVVRLPVFFDRGIDKDKNVWYKEGNMKEKTPRIDKSEEEVVLDSRIEPLHQRLQPEINRARIKEDDFLRRAYSDKDKQLTQDSISEVTELKKKFRESDTEKQKQIKKASEILEFLVYDNIINNDWMLDERDLDGNIREDAVPGAIAMASDYDDLTNKVDLIHLPGGEDTTFADRVQAFSMDMTSAVDQMVLREKVGSVLQIFDPNISDEQLKKGAFAQVRFLQITNLITGQTLDRFNDTQVVPRYTIGVDLDTTLQAASYLYSSPDVAKSFADSNPDDKEDLEMLPDLIAEQVVLQLYAESFVMKKTLDALSQHSKIVEAWSNIDGLEQDARVALEHAQARVRLARTKQNSALKYFGEALYKRAGVNDFDNSRDFILQMPRDKVSQAVIRQYLALHCHYNPGDFEFALEDDTPDVKKDKEVVKTLSAYADFISARDYDPYKRGFNLELVRARLRFTPNKK